MTKLNEMAKAYQPPTTRNISEIERIPIDIDIKQESYVDGEGKPFSVNVAVFEGNKYRVPNSVLEGVKAILEKLPNTKAVTVLKTGQGMNTRYQVIPQL